jgi:hypothetical protein
MAFYPNSYNTVQYEVNSLGTSASKSYPGTAVKLVTLPSGLTTPDYYHKVNVCGASDDVIGVVSHKSSAFIDQMTAGKVVMLNAGLVPVKLSAAASKGDLMKVSSTDGKFEVCASGDLSVVQLVEGGAADDLAWAAPMKVIA